MKLVLVNFQTAKEPWAKDAELEYIKKIKPFFDFEIKTLPGEKSLRAEKTVRLKKEAEAFLGILKPNDYLVVFDEKGKTLNSIQFSSEINKILNSGKQRAYFLIGGPYGVDEELKKKANIVVSVSPMTMNHLVVQTMILEQIYRAATILKNIPYHNP